MNTEPADDARDTTEVTGTREGAAPPRRRTPVIVASVAAAVLLVGGGGAYLAASASDDSGRAGGSAPGGGAPPALALDDPGAAGPSQGIAIGEPNPYGMTYRAQGTLPDGPASAPVYAAKGEVTRDEVARLAKALDVSGTPQRVGGDWTVGGARDGSGASLRVPVQAPGTWTFSRYAPGSAPGCAHAGSCPSAEDSPVSEADAKQAAVPVLKALGQGGAAVDAGRLLGSARMVTADPVVGGLPTHGWSTVLHVAADGEVTGGNGQLKAPVKGAGYPVLDARRTLDLMNGASTSYGRKGIGGCASPVPLKDRDEKPCGASAAAAGRASATVTGAVFGLDRRSVNGAAVLVPSWLFDVREQGAGSTATVARPAVDPRYLTTPRSAGAPSEEPGPRTPSSAPTRGEVAVQGYTTEGTDLTLAFQGGVCADYAASVRESDGEVTVTVTETPWPDKVCIMIAKVYHRTLHLKAPLGDRPVVGADGQRIPRQTADEAASGGLGAVRPQ
ncbi:hypothetical protein AB0L85_03460 [Streptomyces sp. NPDC052051]|uniref:hypothetical protein n=1 Tax=Streptomyces sp. NPDC052051 TaxID=3154649 RepID=UPI003416F999